MMPIMEILCSVPQRGATWIGVVNAAEGKRGLLGVAGTAGYAFLNRLCLRPQECGCPCEAAVE